MSATPKYLYCIEAKLFDDRWTTVVGEQDGSLEYMRGRFDGFRERGGPQPAFRLVRIKPSDDSAEVKVLYEIHEKTELSVGAMPQTVGFQWSRYASAAVTHFIRQHMMFDMQPETTPSCNSITKNSWLSPPK